MFPYVAHVVREDDEGETWNVWLGNASDYEAACIEIEQTLARFNESIENIEHHWEKQSIAALDIYAVACGVPTKVSTFFYSNDQIYSPKIKMVQATEKEVEEFKKEDDIYPQRSLNDDDVYTCKYCGYDYCWNECLDFYDIHEVGC